jgi:DNA polymerase-3 subunit gamma/tau
LPEILYRKWRPRSFSELAGQEHITTTLTNALAMGRVAHAYLFAGPRGTGKTTTGRLLAKALNCTNRQLATSKGDACNQCESCLSYLSGRAMDLIEMDAASNRGIEEIRSLRDKVAFAPGAGEFKVYLIDEVHMLTEAAFNALLKTLEEPPPHVVFILATTDPHKVPATILSRCQRLDFRRAPLGATIGNLERICQGEAITCEPAALELIARSATGSHRDAVNLLDQLATSYGNDLTVEHVRTGLGLIGDERSARLAHYAIDADLAGGLELIGSVRDDGLDLRQFQRELVAELRAFLMVKSGLPSAQSGITEERRRELEAAVANVSSSRILVALRAFGEADLKADPNSTLPLDIALAECVLDVVQSGPATELRTGNQASGQGSRPEPARPAAPSRSESTAPPVKSAAPIDSPTIDIAGPPASAPQPHPEPVEGRAPNGLTASAPPPPAPHPGPASVEPTYAALRQSMRVIYQKAREKSPPLGALLNSGCDIIKFDDREAHFGFKFPNHAQRASEKANLENLKAILLELTGVEMIIACLHIEDVTDWKQREPSSRSSLVRAAQEMGARVVSPRPEGPE